MTNRSDLTQQIAQLLRVHQYLAYQDAGECGCGHVCLRGQHWEHVAQAVTDLLIDLAGTGKLLSGIDRIGRHLADECDCS